jgi:hypothetical protein
MFDLFERKFTTKSSELPLKKSILRKKDKINLNNQSIRSVWTFMSIWTQIKKIIIPQQVPKTNCPKIEILEEEELLAHEIIQRNETENQYYTLWNNSSAKNSFLNWLKDQYLCYRNTGCCDPAVMFLMIPSVNGFVVKFDEGRWHEQDFLCLFDYMKNSIKNREDYWVQVSDIKNVKKGSQTESVQRHYLKPPRQTGLESGEKMDQKFGNLMVSLCIINNKLSSLKLSATHYNDHLFEKAYPFDKLMHVLCEAI